jgi:Ca2+-binding EF-hand superfamily protein
LSYKKISLRRTFEAYDKEGKGNLTFESFRNMISRLDPTFTIEDVHTLFDYIDTDHSKTIEFDELNAYYCKVNGLPYNFDEAETTPMR